MKLRRLPELLSQILNWLTGGYPDEMFSSKLHRKRTLGQWWATRLANSIDWFVDMIGFAPDHCRRCFEAEWKRAKETVVRCESIQNLSYLKKSQ